MCVASADVVEVGGPFADDEAAHERGHGERVAAWTCVCDGEVDQDVIVENVLCEGGAWVPLQRVWGEIDFLMVFELGISDHASDVGVWAAVDDGEV